MTSTCIVIFGASGDLTKRKLIPALSRLHQKGRLDGDVRIVGFARRSYTDDAFRALFADSIDDELARRLFYVRGDLGDAEDYATLDARLSELENGAADRLYYFCRVGMAGRPTTPLTEPDLWASHPALWNEFFMVKQRKLTRDQLHSV